MVEATCSQYLPIRHMIALKAVSICIFSIKMYKQYIDNSQLILEYDVLRIPHKDKVHTQNNHTLDHTVYTLLMYYTSCHLFEQIHLRPVQPLPH